MIQRNCFLLSLIACLACGEDPIPAPQAAELLSPSNMEACTTADPVGPELSVVRFDWADAADTDSYQLYIENITTQERIDDDFLVSEGSLSLIRGVTYRWWVESRSEASTEVATSQKWMFYLEGPAEIEHIPFPAALSYPEENSQVSLEGGALEFRWQGADLDDDIATYELLLGESEDNLSSVATGIEQNSYSTALSANRAYYWQIITVDDQNNRSYSVIGQFQTQ